MTNERAIKFIREVREEDLQTLDLSNKKLARLPPEITELKNLTALGLSNNQLTELPPEIRKLKNLEALFLFNNQLTKLPSEIAELENLQTLDLSNNQLTELPPEIRELKNLTRLDLSNNQLIQLPSEIAELENLQTLDLSNNHLILPPPEIVLRGIEAIFTYLKQSKTTENNEVKLILVGDGDVGKTCLAYRLINNDFLKDAKITEGINISKWEIPAPDSGTSKIKLNIWDFGGQEIYHATHQFFLTKRSLYLLVWNARKPKDFDKIFYWLHTIEAFGEDSPIILVMSKMNESDDDLNIKDLKSKFLYIVDNFKIDSSDGKGINSLTEVISKTAWNLVPLIRDKWVDSWFNVRQELENLDENWITYEKFYRICKSKDLDDKNINVLDDYLNDLGITLHFKDRLTLKNIVILKPEWATGAFYKILSTKSVLHNEGILPQNELSQIWDTETYPPSIHPQLMDLMNKFELSYELPDNNSYLIPELLPKKEPDNFEWNKESDLLFYYCYRYFLPLGIITRFIVRMHKVLDVKENGLPLCWREGAVLQFKGSRALVKMRPDERKIEIRIKGNNKRWALGAICNELDQINASIKKIDVSKRIPCNCSDNCPERFSYETLLKAEMKNVDVQCRQSLNMISASLLLDGYKGREDRMEEYNEILRKNGINLTINPTISSIVNPTISPTINSTVETKVDANQTMKAKLDANVNVNVSIDLKIELPQILTEFDNLKDEIENINPKLDNEMDKIQDSLDELSTNSDKKELAKPFNKLNRFLVKLSDPDSNYNKIIKGTEKGIEHAQKVGRTYNKFAQFLAMPQVPDLFLGK